MRVYDKVVIDLATLEVVEESFVEYSGPVAEAKGGGGGSGGKIGYPAYVETIHHEWLNDTTVDSLDYSAADLMNAAFANDPYAVAVTYDPTVPVAAMLAGATDYETQVDLLSSGTGLNTVISGILSESRITAEVDAFEDDLDARETNTILPRFQAGMRDINAVQSSAFVIGAALIEQNQQRQVATYSASLRGKLYSDTAIQLAELKLRHQSDLAKIIAEVQRMKIVALKEQTDSDVENDVASAKWDLEVLMYGANLLGAPSGGNTLPRTDKPSTLKSALGGAMSGAAAGAMIGSVVPGVGTGVGAAAGAILGASSAFL